jgi:hypothetical protein
MAILLPGIGSQARNNAFFPMKTTAKSRYPAAFPSVGTGPSRALS